MYRNNNQNRPNSRLVGVKSMSAKDKAISILNDFAHICKDPDVAKQCAIIHVKGILEVLDHFGYRGIMYDDFETNFIVMSDDKCCSDYYEKVLIELEKL